MSSMSGGTGQFSSLELFSLDLLGSSLVGRVVFGGVYECSRMPKRERNEKKRQ